MFERKFQNLVSSNPPPPPPAETDPPASELLDKKPLDPHTVARHEDENEQKVTFRLKSAAGAGLLLIVLYALIQAVSPQRASIEGGEYSMRRMSEQEQFEALRASHDTEQAKSKQGFLQRIFCGSHRRSTFCE